MASCSDVYGFTAERLGSTELDAKVSLSRFPLSHGVLAGSLPGHQARTSTASQEPAAISPALFPTAMLPKGLSLTEIRLSWAPFVILAIRTITPFGADRDFSPVVPPGRGGFVVFGYLQ